ncbi:MAG: glycosyltransferase [Acidobacteriota bacterium]
MNAEVTMSPPGPTRILYVLNSASTGGANRSLSVLLAGLDRARFTPCAVVPKAGPILDRLRELDVPVEILPLPLMSRVHASRTGKFKAAVRNRRNVWRLARRLRREGIGIVHTNTIFPLGGALAARQARTPHVWHLREGLDTPEYDLRFGEERTRRMISDLSDAMICISSYVQHVSVSIRGLPRSRVIPNAVEMMPERDVREPGRPVTIGCVGLIGRKKRTQVFIEAALRVAAVRPDVRFVVAGRPVAGEEKIVETSQRRIRDARVDERFDWPGFVSNPADLFARMDLLIHPGVHEAFGRVLIEAMSWGIPVVSVRSGAIPEVIRDGATGLLVPPDDARALADAALGILLDPRRYTKFSRAARRDVIERFDPDLHVRDVTRLYDELLGAPRSASSRRVRRPTPDGRVTRR